MQKLVSINLLKSINSIYDVLNPSNLESNVNFGTKLDYLRKLNPEDLFLKELSIEQQQQVSTILENILNEIDSKFYGQSYVDTGNKLGNMISEFQSQLINLIIKYEESENRVLLHYSQFPTYSKDWNNVTKYSRGIVIDLDDYKVIVHPYDKFFNYLEVPETKDANLPCEKYEVSTKLDGSEGILYPMKNGNIRIITKGSFDSAQGEFATEVLYSKYPKEVEYIKDKRLYDYYTFTFEILYSQDDPNRIVVAYEEPDLRLIGVKDLRTGKDLSYSEVINMAKSIGFSHTEIENITLGEILEEREKRENFEGWVVRFDSGLYMKIKCKSYLELHGARFGSSIKSVFLLLKENKWDDFISSVPKEIKPIPEALQKRILNFAQYQIKKIHEAYYSLPKFESQKDFAIYIDKNVDSQFKSYMFQMRSGKEINVFNVPWEKFRDSFESWEKDE